MRAASCSCRSDRRRTISTAAIARDRTSTPTASSRSMRRPGGVRWHFQTVHHDLWDYDIPAQPVLVTVRHSGRRVDAVAQVAKTGFVYLLDRGRRAGRCFRSRSGRCPRARCRAKRRGRRSRFRRSRRSLARIAPLTRDELSDVTPESQRYCEALFDRVVSGGIFTPHGEKLTLVFPGQSRRRDVVGRGVRSVERLPVRQRQRARRRRRDAQGGRHRSPTAAAAICRAASTRGSGTSGAGPARSRRGARSAR